MGEFIPNIPDDIYNDDDLEMYELSEYEFVDIYHDRPRKTKSVSWSTILNPAELMTRARAIYGNPSPNDEAVLTYTDEEQSHANYCKAAELSERIAGCAGTLTFVAMQCDGIKIHWHAIETKQSTDTPINQASVLTPSEDANSNIVSLMRLTGTPLVQQSAAEIL